MNARLKSKKYTFSKLIQIKIKVFYETEKITYMNMGYSVSLQKKWFVLNYYILLLEFSSNIILDRVVFTDSSSFYTLFFAITNVMLDVFVRVYLLTNSQTIAFSVFSSILNIVLHISNGKSKRNNN